MIGAIKAEVVKLLTVRTWWILLAVLAGYIGLIAVGIAFFVGTLSSSDASLSLSGAPAIVYSVVTSSGYAIPVILGAMAVTGEFRHQTLTPTFLSQPRRGVVLGAKMVVLVLAGAVFGLVGIIVSTGLGASVLASLGVGTGLESVDTWLLLARIVLAMALWAVIGVALGTLVPNQIASIVIVLAFTQFVEPMLRTVAALWDVAAEIGKFLPSSASDALVGASFLSIFSAQTTVPLEWWQGGLVLLGYGALFAVAGFFTSWRRDVT